jgi:hypothetical protein
MTDLKAKALNLAIQSAVYPGNLSATEIVARARVFEIYLTGEGDKPSTREGLDSFEPAATAAN